MNYVWCYHKFIWMSIVEWLRAIKVWYMHICSNILNRTMLYSSLWSNGPAVTSEMFVKIWESLNTAYVKFGGDGYFPTKITTPTFHVDMKIYSVWGRSYYACCFFIHIHNLDAYCSSHKMPNLNWAYLTNNELDPH